jgi:arabinofuranosyltransferase
LAAIDPVETRGGSQRVSPVALAVLMLAMGAFVLHAKEYWPFLSDDALISLRYAQRFAEGHGLTWTAGERVEGYTDFLWVLLIALWKKLGNDPIQSARAFDFVSAELAILLVSFDPKPFRLSFPRVLSGGFALAGLAPLAVWAIGGLEHGFMAGVTVAALLMLSRALDPEPPRRRELYGAGALFAVLVLSRADGVVLAGAAGLGALVAQGRPSRASLKTLAMIFGVPVGALALQHVFRYAYYHELVPNTALVKVAFNRARVDAGWEHVRHGYKPVWPLVVLAVVALLAGYERLRRERWLPALFMALLWPAYLVVVGGDIFPGWRQVLLGLVPIAVLLAEGAQAAAARVKWGPLAVPVVTIPVLFACYRQQSVDSENRRAISERWELDGFPVGRALRDAFAKQEPLLAVDAAGALPYWSELPCLDMLGLNDKYIATHPPKSFGHGGIGHELGDGRYVWERRPDLIAFNNAGGARDPIFLSGRQLLRMPEFRRTYQLVRVQGNRGNRATGEIWFNREGGKLGVQRSEQAIRIPGYFFGGAEAVASPDPSGALVTTVRMETPAKLPAFEIPAGKWRLDLDPPSAGLAVAFRCDGTSSTPSGPVGPPSIELGRPTPIDIVVGTLDSGAVAIRSATLTRVQSARYRCERASDGWIDLPVAELAHIQPENAPWAGPASAVFRAPGLRIHPEGMSHARQIDLSVDNNDVYDFDLMNGPDVVGTLRVSPRRNRGGLAVHRLAVPEPAREKGFDRIDVRPVSGDGSFSLGHFVLIEQ